MTPELGQIENNPAFNEYQQLCYLGSVFRITDRVGNDTTEIPINFNPTEFKSVLLGMLNQLPLGTFQVTGISHSRTPLEPKEIKQVIINRYGLDGSKPMAFGEISKQTGKRKDKLRDSMRKALINIEEYFTK